MCAGIFGSKRILANMKRIFIRFEANKICFIRFFLIEVNQRILHAKRIKTKPNIYSNRIFCLFPFKVNILSPNEANI